VDDKTILAVDDTVTNLDILEELLDQYDVISTISGKDALKIIDEEEVDLILLDIMMPDMDGFEVCQILKSNERTKDIPIIFITARTDEDSIEKAYDLGGADYVTKPFRPKELLSRVKKELKYKDMVDKLNFLASIDPMTKLYNRRYFTKASSHILNLAKRDKKELSIIMIDIDKFKNVNDTYGHGIGDDVIISLAHKLIGHQRTSDIICRYGGEEFVILLPNTSILNAKSVAQKLRVDIEQSRVSLKENQELKYTISLGVSQVDTQNEIDIEAALKRADEALYDAKESGRNRVRVIA